MPTALLSRKYMPDPGTSSYITAAALMEFFSLKVVCALLPLACCHQCVYPSFFQLPLVSVGSTGFWWSRDCDCGMVDSDIHIIGVAVIM